MGTPIAFASGTTNSFNLGTTKRGTIALNTGTNLTSGFNWWNGVDVSATQYLIYSDTFSQGQATIATARPTAWTTPDLNDSSLLALINTLPDRVGQNLFTDINVALQWLQNSEKYFLIKGGCDNIVTNGLIMNLDAGWATSYPGNTSSIASAWTDYNNSQAFYSAIGNNGVVLLSTTTNWVGYFPATVNTPGIYTIEFDYVTNSAGTLVLDNDGIVDNEWNANISNSTTPQKYRATRYIGTTGNISFFLRRNSGGNHTITNFKFSNTNTWFDLSGSGNHANLVNSPTYLENFGGVFDFDGVDDYAFVPDNASLDIIGDKTQAIWIYMDSSYGGTGMLGKANSTVNGMALSYGWSSGGFQNIAWNSTNNPSLSPIAADINNWYYVVGVQNGDTRYVYVLGANGLRVASHVGGNNRWDNSLNFTIGVVAGYYTNMKAAAVHVYNRALSVDEIQQNYDAQKGRFGLGGQSLFSGVTQYLDFSKSNSYPGSGTDLLDISGNGYHDSITSAAAVTTIDGVKCLNCANGAQINGNLSNTPTLGNNYTIFCWARVISSSSEYRTLFRTYDDDHPLLVEAGSNRIGYYDNNSGGGFVNSGLDVGTLGLAERWVLYTIVGSGGNTQTFYINDGTNSGSVNYNATGEQMDDICNHSGQIFGPVSSSILYNNQAFTQSQVSQYFDATKQYYGYASNNIPNYGLVMNLDAGNPISYPGTGTVWYDSSGNGVNGTLENGASYSTSGGGSITFDGVDDRVSVAHNNLLNFGTGDFTVLVWVSGVTSYPGGNKAIIMKGSRFDANSAGWGIMWAGSPEDLYFIISSDSARIEGRTSPNGGLNGWTGWKLIGMSRIGGNWYQIVDTTFTLLGTFTGNVDNTQTLYIAYNSVYGGYLSSSYGNALIYNRGLSQSELIQLYNAQKSRFGL